MSSTVNRNNVLAGVFVVASLALAITIAFILGDVLDAFGSKREYTVRFPTAVGVGGLQPGADVTFAGLPVGKVKSITPFRPGGENAPAQAMDVLIAVDADLLLYENATADLSPPLLGGVSKINFTSAGTGAISESESDALSPFAISNQNGTLDEGETVRGRFAPSILAQLGFSVEDAERIRNTIADVEKSSANVVAITDRFNNITADIEPVIDETIADARAAVGDVKAFTTNFNAEDGWKPRVDAILAATENTLQQGPEIARDARDAIANARSLFEDNRNGINNIIANIEATTDRVNVQTMQQVEELMQQGTLTLTSYRGFADNANATLAQARPDISVALTNTRSISQQARLFLDEIRAQPWRLLKQPSEADLKREPLYAAARSYASAVADLRAASEALDAAITSQSMAAAADPGEIMRIAQAVQAAYDGYDRAEQALLETLRTTKP